MHLKLLQRPAVIILLALASFNVHAQSKINYFVPQPFPRSPTATAIEKYGTYQVNEFTGVPDISIPLYTVEAGGLQVPITLSYHASGNKVTDVASWCGLGWSISSSGQITRKALGLPDDVSYGYLNGNFLAYSAINTGTYAGVYYLENVANGNYDSKPDIYSYDFPGHSGKFFFDGTAHNGTYPVRMLPYAPLSVKYKMIPYSTITPPPATGLTTFYIADEHGNNYTFGDAAVETTYSSTGGHLGSTTASAWKLESMISQNRRDTVSFSYKTDTINYPAADGEILTVVDQIAVIDTQAYNNASHSIAPTTPGNINITLEELPQQINFKNGRVVFDLDPMVRADVNGGTPGDRAYGLTDIKIYQYNYGTKTMELQKTIMFYKSYFNADLPGAQRLRLDSLQILDKAGAVMQHYRFDYNTSLALPAYTSKQQDYWGYYNGKNNDMLTPQQSVTFQPNATSGTTYVTIGSSVLNGRDCDSNYMQADILTGIHYPTGGYSTFTYQTNRWDTSGTVNLAGGLRIKTISSYDGINPTPIIKTYVYNSSRHNFILDYDYFSTSQIHRYYMNYRDNTPRDVCYETVRTFSSSPHCDLEAFDGATVVYPSVTEYIGTPGTNAGRTDYTFTDQQDALSDASMAGNAIYLSSFYVRGHLLSKIDYLNNGTSYQPVKSVYNAYTAFPYTNYNDVGMAAKKLYYNEGPVGNNPFSPGTALPDDGSSFLYPFYYITSDDNYLTGTMENIYDTNDSTKYTTSVTAYNYDNIAHQQVTRTYHTDSKGNTTVARTMYPADYPSGNAIIDSMVNRNMQAEAIEKYDTLKNAASGVNGIVSAQLNKYKAGSISHTIVPSTVSTLSVALPLTNFTPATVSSGSLTSDARYLQMISFDNYDAQNNIIQYTPRNATHTAILWDHTYELPVAQVKNAPNYSATVTTYAYTGFEADGKGNWVYAGAPLVDATAPAGNYSYPLSAGTVTTGVMDGTKSYVVSYWSTGGAATVGYNSTNYSGTALMSANGWAYYEHQLPTITGGSALSISGSVSIDELRLYPANAQVTTYNYDPSGLRSISDAKGANSYFDYDYLQRLKNMKDWEGNIVKNYGYHMYDQLFGNQSQTASFTRKNCPGGTTPGSLSFTVPANKYYSSAQASANADAIYDLNLNGQIKANTNCGCPITTVTITLTNTTGLTGFQAVFSGLGTPLNFNSTSSPATFQVPIGTYATVTINDVNSSTHTYGLTGYTSQVVHNASFTSVAVVSGSPLILSIQ